MTARDFRERRVLFIGTPLFGYHREIIKSFNAAGYAVDHYDDRPSENSVIKGAIKIRPSVVHLLVQRHFQRILSETQQSQYDLIFVLNGKTLTRSFVHDLRARQPQAQAVLYLWDAIDLYPHVLELAPLFDRRYSFDRRDVMNYPEFTLMPLFYTNDYGRIPTFPHAGDTYDLLNVCTAHPNRYAIMRNMLPALEGEGLRVFSYLYQNPLQLAYNRWSEPAFKKARLREFRFRPLDPPAHLELVRHSRAVLDVNHAAQSGLTMRTIETIGARRKLVTTNQDVQEYSFYDPSRIHVVDPFQVDAPSIREFINSPMVPLDQYEHEALGIDNWVRMIIESDTEHD